MKLQNLFIAEKREKPKDDGDTYSEIENEIIEKYGLQDYVKDMYGG